MSHHTPLSSIVQRSRPTERAPSSAQSATTATSPRIAIRIGRARPDPAATASIGPVQTGTTGARSEPRGCADDGRTDGGRTDDGRAAWLTRTSGALGGSSDAAAGNATVGTETCELAGPSPEAARAIARPSTTAIPARTVDSDDETGDGDDGVVGEGGPPVTGADAAAAGAFAGVGSAPDRCSSRRVAAKARARGQVGRALSR